MATKKDIIRLSSRSNCRFSVFCLGKPNENASLDVQLQIGGDVECPCHSTRSFLVTNLQR
nr:hypothetical protein Iba_chr09eCG1240 [Ipomoea batatas]